MGDTDAAAHRLSEAEADRLAALDAERPPDLDDVGAIRARLPAPWELADAREWADFGRSGFPLIRSPRPNPKGATTLGAVAPLRRPPRLLEPPGSSWRGAVGSGGGPTAAQHHRRPARAPERKA